MDKNHPLSYITRKRKAKEHEIDTMLDMIVLSGYLAGKFDNPIPVDDTREAWQHIKRLLKQVL